MKYYAMAFSLFFALSIPCAAFTWHQFHGDPQHTGRAPSSCDCDTPEVIWSFRTGAPIYGSAVFDGDAIYFGSYDSYIYCVNQLSGEEIWSYHVDAGIRRAGAIANDSTVVFACLDSFVYALHRDTGALLWSYPTVSQCLSAVTWDPATNHVYLTSDHDASWRGWIYAFTSDGAMLWNQTPPGGGTWMSVSPALNDFGHLITADAHNPTANVTAYDSATGAIDWNINPSTPSGENDIHSSPAVDTIRDRIYYGEDSGNQRIMAIDYTSTSASVAWTYLTGASINSSPAIGVDGTVYIGSGDGSLYAMNPDGSLRWTFATGGAVSSSPIVDTTGAVIFGSNDHFLYCLDSTGTELWRIELGAAVASSPAIDQYGVIYIGCNDSLLYAIGCLTHPEVQIVSPAPDIFSSCDNLDIVLYITDEGMDFNPESVELTIDDGLHYTFFDGMSFSNDTLVFTPDVPWLDGQVVDICITSCSDSAGIPARNLPICWNFTVDLSPPVMQWSNPLDGEIVPDAQPYITAFVIDSLSGFDTLSAVIQVGDNTYPADHPAIDWAFNVLSIDMSATGDSLDDTILVCLLDASDMPDTCPPNSADLCFSFIVDISGPSVFVLEPSPDSYSSCDDQGAIFVLNDPRQIDSTTVWATINEDTLLATWLLFDGETLSVQPPSGYFTDGETITVCAGGNDTLGNPPDSAACITYMIDLSPPTYSNFTPADGDTVVLFQPTISAMLDDAASGIDSASVWITVNGLAATPAFDGVIVTWRPDTEFIPSQWLYICIGAEDAPDYCLPNASQMCCSIFVLEHPDLWFENLATNPEEPIYEGQEFVFSGKIHNNEYQDVSSFDVTVLCDSQQIGSIPFAGGLGIMESDSISWDFALSIGPHWLCFSADDNDAVLESNEMNNTECIEIYIEGVECSRVPNPFTPNGDGINDYAQFTFPGLYTEGASIHLFDLHGIKVMQIDVDSSSDPKLAARWHGRDANGNPLSQGLYIYVTEVSGEITCEGTITIAR